MIFEKKFLLLTLFFIIILQALLYINNNQKTSFRYFKWTVQEASIGQLISISFFSGLFVSTLLNTNFTSFKKNTFEEIEENYEPLNNDDDLKSNLEMPPQRDIRDTQPTISVNYRVIKNNDENFESLSDQDELLISKSIELIKSSNKASTSYLQRNFQIGYNKAARIMEALEQRGVVSEPSHTGKREILIKN